MSYEGMTYEVILKRMINRVTTKYPNLDIREGSMVFNSLASAAVEAAIMFTEIDNSRNESFVDTATREYALLGCKQIGMDINQFEASPSVHKGEFNVKVPLGSRWNCDLYNYEVTEYLGVENAYYTYRLVCETTGAVPNVIVGDLIAISDNPTGLNHAKLIECIIEGEDETTDDGIKAAYYNFLNSSATDGNVLQYQQWCDEYDGIGRHKIFPLWNGANTVKVSILSTSNDVASAELIAEFQNYLDPGVTGMGDGVAPIGAFVTVSTATEVPINVSATVTLKNGYNSTSLVEQSLRDYFKALAYSTPTVDTTTVVSYFAVASAILNTEGVASVSNVTVNGSTVDVFIGAEEIPVLGTGNWTVK